MEISEKEGQLLKALREEGLVASFSDSANLHEWMESSRRTTADEDADEEGAASVDKEGKGKKPPKLSVFAGDQDFPGAVEYQLWRHEVNCLMEEGLYSNNAIRLAVRRSLQKEAALLSKRLGSKATLTDILGELEKNFGVVQNEENALDEFRKAKQGLGESVTSWALRLEELIDQVGRQGIVAKPERDKLVRLQFWSGLLSQLKEGSQHIFDSTDTWTDLKTRMRTVEGRIKRDKQQQGECRSLTNRTSPELTIVGKEVKELRGMIHKLTNKIESMQTANVTPPVPPTTSTQSPASASWQPRQQRLCNPPRPPPIGNPSPHRQMPTPQQRGGYAQRSGYAYQTPRQPVHHQVRSQGRAANANVCFQCGQHGHWRRECPRLRCYSCGAPGHVSRECTLPLN